MTLKQLRQRRDNFIAILDTTKPNWKSRIDKNRLDMSYCEDCILGQLYGLYTRGMLELNLNNEEAVKYALQVQGALSASFSGSDGQVEEDYAKLTKVWKEVL